jgi:hypothetical protein
VVSFRITMILLPVSLWGGWEKESLGLIEERILGWTSQAVSTLKVS